MRAKGTRYPLFDTPIHECNITEPSLTWSTNCRGENVCTARVKEAIKWIIEKTMKWVTENNCCSCNMLCCVFCCRQFCILCILYILYIFLKWVPEKNCCNYSVMCYIFCHWRFCILCILCTLYIFCMVWRLYHLHLRQACNEETNQVRWLWMVVGIVLDWEKGCSASPEFFLFLNHCPSLPASS